MSKADVRRALVAMDGEEVRRQLAAGDFSELEDLDLDDHERQLLQDAAEEYPEVAGFSFDSAFASGGFIKIKWTDLENTAPAVHAIIKFTTTTKDKIDPYL